MCLPSCPSSCSWRPQDIGVYLQRDTRHRRLQARQWVTGGSAQMFVSPHNEFLVSAAHWKANLPNAIEAWIAGEQYTGADYQAFLRRFGLTEADVPLLSFANDDQHRAFVSAYDSMARRRRAGKFRSYV